MVHVHVNIGIFVKSNEFKQVNMSIGFKTIKQFIMIDVNSIIVHLYGSQSQFFISVYSL